MCFPCCNSFSRLFKVCKNSGKIFTKVDDLVLVHVEDMANLLICRKVVIFAYNGCFGFSPPSLLECYHRYSNKDHHQTFSDWLYHKNSSHYSPISPTYHQALIKIQVNLILLYISNIKISNIFWQS